MTTVNYACAIQETKWFVVCESTNLFGEIGSVTCLITGNYWTAKSECDLQRSRGVSAKLVKRDVHFVSRCVTCGEYSSSLGDKEIFDDWYSMADWLPPGWCATSELQVFCPNHRPDKEE